MQALQGYFDNGEFYQAGKKVALPEHKYVIINVLDLPVDWQEHTNDTDYLASIPGMMESIIDGINTPSSECVPLSEVWPDV